MRDITLCHPRLQALAGQLIEECGKQGIKIKIGETLRTVEEQDALYAQGRTKPGPILTNAPGSSYSSHHQWGTAFDFFRNDGQGAYNESGNFFGKVGAIGVSLGLEWGGNWKNPVDKPHFQLPDWGSTTRKLRSTYETPEEFMKTWEPEKSGWIHDAHGWWYREPDGGYPRMCWRLINHHWYLFGGSGYALTGWVQWNSDTQRTGSGDWYYLDESGDYLGACWHEAPGGKGAMERWYVE